MGTHQFQRLGSAVDGDELEHCFRDFSQLFHTLPSLQCLEFVCPPLGGSMAELVIVMQGYVQNP